MAAIEPIEPTERIAGRSCYRLNSVTVHWWPEQHPPIGTLCACGQACPPPGEPMFERDVLRHGHPSTWPPNLRRKHRALLGASHAALDAAENELARDARAAWPGQ